MSMTKPAREWSAALILLGGVLTGGLFYLFDRVELPGTVYTRRRPETVRDHFEHHLYDLRMRLRPAGPSMHGVVLVTIDSDSIRSLDGPRAEDLSLESWQKVLRSALSSNAAKIGVLPPVSLLADLASGAEVMAGWIRLDPRIFLGTLNLVTEYPPARPQAVGPLLDQDRAAGADLFRSRRNDRVRTFPLVGYSGGMRRPLLPARMADFPTETYSGLDRFMLNYANPASLLRIKAEDLVRDAVIRERLTGATVFVGYEVFRDRPMMSEQIAVVTPWQRAGVDPADGGESLVSVLAMIYANLRDRTYLVSAPPWVAWAQGVPCVVVTLGVWSLGAAWGTALTLLVAILWLVAHVLVLTFTSFYIPLADTAVGMSFAAIAGSVWCRVTEGRRLRDEGARAEAQQSLALTQGRFLDTFARELRAMGDQVIDLLKSVSLQMHVSDAQVLQMHRRLLGSSEEFGDYLRAIQQFADAAVVERRSARSTLVDLERLLRRIVQQFDSRCDEAGITVTIRGASGVILESDETILEAIVFNLVANAIKYSPQGGLVEIEAESTERYLQICVRDCGPGIAPEHHERIFEKFFRVEDPDTQKVKGNGMGLFLSRYFATHLGGRLQVQSTKGAGAMFTLKLQRRERRRPWSSHSHPAG